MSRKFPKWAKKRLEELRTKTTTGDVWLLNDDGDWVRVDYLTPDAEELQPLLQSKKACIIP